MSRKPRQKKCNNEYKILDKDYEEIVGLENKSLISRVSLEYANWTAVEKQKKEDPKLNALKQQIKDMEEAIKENEEYQEIKVKLDEKFEELADESLPGYKEEKKNILEPYTEDITRFKAFFKCCMDEMNRRKQSGVLVIEGKIV